MNIPQFKQVVKNTKDEYKKMIDGEIRVMGLREKIESRLQTMTKIVEILNDHIHKSI